MLCGKSGKMDCAASAALSYGILVGFAATYSSVAIELMKKPSSHVIPSDDQLSWFASLLAVGALFGGIFAGYLSNVMGRKGVLMFTTLPCVTGWLIIAYAPSIHYVLVGRFLTGLCCGIVCVVTPIYVVEVSSTESRGRLGASFQVFITIGVVLIASFGMCLSWNWCAVVAGIYTLFAAVYMFPVPESPRWLLAHDRPAEAVKAVYFLRGENFDAQAECMTISESLNQQPRGGLSFQEFLEPSVYKPALLSIGLMFFQQFSGSNAILFYTVSIFKQVDSSADPFHSNLFVAIVMLTFTAVSSYIIDKVGRKKILLLSGFLMFISLTALGVFSYFSKTETILVKQLSWVPLFCVLFYIASFSIGFGPIPWLMMAEMTPLRVRSAVCGMGTAFSWAFTFTVTKSFLSLEDVLCNYGVYWFYAAFCLCSCIFTLCLPETKGRPLEDIISVFNGGRSRLNDDAETGSVALPD